ncbi:hypothetical protein CkaCkLH20_05259 [Colletotrichum karsti]|uniref:Cupin type-2 domain-containing protein n=1 Tax=Colletotrichum karsti TaxID=1095194 RepID=A0A9P6I5Y0_9PEZI|nr:uncharacterized protein CkaCkLH20_05259 [Colletotrichum karsti]KAF9876993.1 hypothetical protein CkaCkLH20_05259 [Colletotrichum karsti]
MSISSHKPVLMDHATITRLAESAFPEPVYGNVTWQTLLSRPDTLTDSMCAGLATCPPEGFLALHQHTQAEIYYILSGTGTVEIDGKRHAVSGGSILWIPGDAVHGVFCGPGETLHWLYVFPEARFEDIIYRFQEPKTNIFLATCHAILEINANVDIHLASFISIKSAVTATSTAALEANPNATPIKFHEINGTSHFTALFAPSLGGSRLLSVAPTFWNMPTILRIISRAAMPFTGPQMVENYNEIRRIIAEVQPDLTVVDNLFTPGMTAARQMGIKWMILSPNTLKDLALPLQPRAAFFWKYPCVGTALSFPIPWHLIPLNVLYVFILIFFMIFDNHARAARKYVTEKTGARIFDQAEFSSPQPYLTILMASHPEFDFLMDYKPENIIPCGPIMRPVSPVRSVDSELENWLARGPTVFVNLGTLSWTTEDQAVEMAKAIRSVMIEWHDHDNHQDGRLQVLWKLKQTPDGHTEYETGNVVCSVNHGGANSFWEAVCAGVPQVVLPVWADTYDYAQRAEYLGIGKWGSKTSAPRYGAQELGSALHQVLMGPSASRMQVRARLLAKLRAQKGEGRDVAAKHIVESVGR